MFASFRRVADERAQHGERGTLQPKRSVPLGVYNKDGGCVYSSNGHNFNALHFNPTLYIFKSIKNLTQKAKNFSIQTTKNLFWKKEKINFFECRNRKIFWWRIDRWICVRLICRGDPGWRGPSHETSTLLTNDRWSVKCTLKYLRREYHSSTRPPTRFILVQWEQGEPRGNRVWGVKSHGTCAFL